MSLKRTLGVIVFAAGTIGDAQLAFADYPNEGADREAADSRAANQASEQYIQKQEASRDQDSKDTDTRISQMKEEYTKDFGGTWTQDQEQNLRQMAKRNPAEFEKKYQGSRTLRAYWKRQLDKLPVMERYKWDQKDVDPGPKPDYPSVNPNG